MSKKHLVRKLAIILSLCLILSSLSGCAWFSNQVKNIKGQLIGNHFTIDFFDNFGNKTLTIDGKKVGIEANYIKTNSISSDGTQSNNYELSSVITLNVDGHQVPQTGDTVIFAEDGLKPLEDFDLPNTITTSGGTINMIDRNINKIKNIIGTKKVVVVCSQLGLPIAVYGGNKVYWEIPDDLPKTTNLNIDGLALYIHRANFILLDQDMIK